MRREKLYLTDIIEAADAIQRFLKGIKQNTFLKNDLLQSAVLQKLTIIGEAAARLPKEFHETHSEIEWEDIIGFRTFLKGNMQNLGHSRIKNPSLIPISQSRMSVARLQNRL